MKSLYLLPPSETLVELDGPSLLVTSPKSAARRFPLALIARVVTGKSARWTAAALAGCLQAGIPVIFLSSGGAAAVGTALPDYPQEPSREERLLNLLNRPGGAESLQNWFRKQERDALLRASRSMGVWLEDLRPAAARAALDRFVLRRWPEAAKKRILDILETGVRAITAETWIHEGLSAKPVMGDKSGSTPVRSILDIVRWDIYPLAARFVSRAHTLTAETAVAFLESEADACRRRVSGLLDAMFVWIGNRGRF